MVSSFCLSRSEKQIEKSFFVTLKVEIEYFFAKDGIPLPSAGPAWKEQERIR
jgi:hypothetical protein